MATFGLSWTTENTTGNVSYKVYWREAETSLWTYAITSGTTYSVALQADNTLFDFAIQNINNDDNPTTATFQGIGFTDPNPTFSIANDSIAFSFDKPTDYITAYTATIALFTTPETVIQTISVPSPGDTVSGTFTGLTNSTIYTVSLLVAANEFNETFTYNEATTDASTCYPPTSSYGYLTSGTAMTITWDSPITLPDGGFIGSYRRRAMTTPYETFVTSGTTSGNTYSLTVEAPASYDGYMQSVCTALDSTSEQDPFGVNAYLPLNFSAETNVAGQLVLTVYSDFGNPYDTLVTGTIVASDASSNAFSVTYDATNTTQEFTIVNNLPPSQPATSITVSSIAPAFDNGGQIQQLDTVLTPDYFLFYNGLTSGTTWNGNPALLPSFTLDNFIPTEQDVDENITKGLLNFSWIYNSVYMSGVSPYTFVTLKVLDPADDSVMGTVIMAPTPIGLRNNSIEITKQITAITDANQFKLRLYWANGSNGGTVTFYLPVF